jgi:uncharacterized Ntn-hydrolase superfamily protein
MSYAVVARCARTGQLGIAVASHAIASGRHFDGALRANTGAIFSVGASGPGLAPDPRVHYLAIRLLAQGRNLRQVASELLKNDSDVDHRCFAMVDREGQTLFHAGESAAAGAFSQEGPGIVAFGLELAGEDVVRAMAHTMETQSRLDLDERLLLALEAGCVAGGIRKGSTRLAERSAGLAVWGNKTYNELDLRVDLHEAAVADLRRIYTDYRPSVAYYEERAKHPRVAIPAMEFADMLAKKQREAA